MKIFNYPTHDARRSGPLKMKFFLKYTFLVASCILRSLFLAFLFSPVLQAALSDKAIAVTSDLRATKAATEVLGQGGNAIDAVVAAAWVLNVVQPQSSGLGGSGYLLFYDIGTRRILFFDGSVQTPAEVFAEMFFDEKGELRPYRSDRNTGGLPVGTPGLLKLLEEVHARYGTQKFSFEKLFDPAIQEAGGAAAVSASLAQAIQEHKERLALFDAGRGLFLKNNQPVSAESKISQPDLAKTFRLIQSKGIRIFYEGEIAKAIVQTVQKNSFRPGFLNYRDLEDYSVARRDPIHITYEGYDVFSVSPPAAGGIMLFRALNILSQFGLAGFGKTAETYHILEETQKHAFTGGLAIADPDVFEVPLEELLSEKWAQERRESIKFDKVLRLKDSQKNTPETGRKQMLSSVLVADTHGNIAALTMTLGDAFGSAVMVPGYGFFLNNQLTDFNATPDLVKKGEAVNIPSPGQRPRAPVVSTLVFEKGKPFLVMDVYGDEDPAAVLMNLFVQKIDFGRTCADSITASRILDREGILWMEPGIYAQETMRVKLELLGHKIEKKEKIGTAQMICFEDSSGKIAGESDPRQTL